MFIFEIIESAQYAVYLKLIQYCLILKSAWDSMAHKLESKTKMSDSET